MYKIIRRLFSSNPVSKDFSQFLDGNPKSKKQLLIEECKRRNISVFLDNPTEPLTGIYVELRGVASEAELERRLNAAKAVSLSKLSNSIATIALIVSLIALVKSFL